MKDMAETILASLADIGLGPQRLSRARAGSALFGAGGILNSIELVQFIVALSERTGVDSFEFMESFDVGAGVFESLSSIRDFLEARPTREMTV